MNEDPVERGEQGKEKESDSIIERTGTHPLGAAVGAVGGAVAGAVIGIAAGPVGSLAGAVGGAALGAALGSGASATSATGPVTGPPKEASEPDAAGADENGPAASGPPRSPSGNPP